MEAKRLILETDAEQMAITLAEAETLRIAAPNLLETAMVSISRRGDEGSASHLCKRVLMPECQPLPNKRF